MRGLEEMSYRVPRDDQTYFFRIPNHIPLVVSGRPVQDMDIESRVNKALLSEFETNTAWHPKQPANNVWQPKQPATNAWWGWRPWWWSLRCCVGAVLSHLCAFSLGHWLK